MAGLSWHEKAAKHSHYPPGNAYMAKESPKQCLSPPGDNTAEENFRHRRPKWTHKCTCNYPGMQQLSLLVLLRNHYSCIRGNNWRQIQSILWFLWTLDQILNAVSSTTAPGDTTAAHGSTHGKFIAGLSSVEWLLFCCVCPALPWELTEKNFQFHNLLSALSSHTRQN